MTRYSDIYGEYTADMQHLDNAKKCLARARNILYTIDSAYVSAYDIIETIDAAIHDIQEIRADITDVVGFEMSRDTIPFKSKKYDDE
jgi:hypothetical protein